MQYHAQMPLPSATGILLQLEQVEIEISAELMDTSDSDALTM